MSRIFWDAMLFIYLLEEHPTHAERVRRLLERSLNRGDSLFTSCLALGEILAGAEGSADDEKAKLIRNGIHAMGFVALPFNEGAIVPFGRLRAKQKLKVADSIHLACAASAGIDLFLTGDKQLMRLDVPGIQFIADFTMPIL